MNNGVYIIGISDCLEDVCAASGRISTQKGSSLEVFERSHDKQKNANLIDKVTKSGHNSTIEHSFINLAFENVSVVVEQFMIEFRLASFTVKSRRYVDFGSSGYYVPKFDSEALTNEYTAHMDSLFALYNKMCEAEIPKEDARFILPYCFYSNFYCSLNARELINVLRAMIYGRGKNNPEIFALGQSLLAQGREKIPAIFIDFEKRNEKYNDGLYFDFEVSETKTIEEKREKIQILSCSSDCETTMAKTALFEQNKYTATEIETIVQNKENVEKIMQALIKSSRPRALETFNCCFKFNDITLSCLTHIARHRMQGLSIPQLDTLSPKNYIVPPTIELNKDLLQQFNLAFENTAKLYDKIKASDNSDSLLVYCLLSGCTIDVISTMNARELLLFFKLRSCTRAQWEIQEYANELLVKLRNVSPAIFGLMGPSCYSSIGCPEGKLTCGRAKEIREKFKSL